MPPIPLQVKYHTFMGKRIHLLNPKERWQCYKAMKVATFDDVVMDYHLRKIWREGRKKEENIRRKIDDLHYALT